jgi:hypothetical protein
VVVPVNAMARGYSNATAPSYAAADSLGEDIARRLIRDVGRALPPATVSELRSEPGAARVALGDIAGGDDGLTVRGAHRD